MAMLHCMHHQYIQNYKLVRSRSSNLHPLHPQVVRQMATLNKAIGYMLESAPSAGKHKVAGGTRKISLAPDLSNDHDSAGIHDRTPVLRLGQYDFPGRLCEQSRLSSARSCPVVQQASSLDQISGAALMTRSGVSSQGQLSSAVCGPYAVPLLYKIFAALLLYLIHGS